jgi:dipeptidyl aminopeptidase/acylaminoacyl peptidase
MPEPRTDAEQELAPQDAGGGSQGRLRIVLPLALVGVFVATVIVLAAGLVTTQGSLRVVASPPSGAPSAAPSGASATSLIAVIDESGALATMDERGGSRVSYAVPGVVFGFPAWSPDGSRIAAVGHTPDDTSIYVFTVLRGGSGGHAKPVAIYRSPDRPPFYLYWTPDSQRVAFLATEPAGLSLRIAPANGAAPLDGSGPGAIIRRGAPLYFDWEGADRLLLHVGTGSSAFVGEVGLDGASVAPAVPGTGDFRSASASRDGRYLAYVRSGTDSSGQIVIESRDGASRHGLPVFGPAAFAFDPTGDMLASIAADKPVPDAPAFPLGTLRLIDASTGAVRTLLDGAVVAFFWAPDGRTIAALRLAQPADQTSETGPFLTAAVRARPVAAATPSPGVEVRLAFIDVATGTVRSERVVRPASDFVNQILPYFDQYALSHHLWAPDSASILLPLVHSSGGAQLVVIPADGTDSRPIADGVSGFWSP